MTFETFSSDATGVVGIVCVGAWRYELMVAREPLVLDSPEGDRPVQCVCDHRAQRIVVNRDLLEGYRDALVGDLVRRIIAKRGVSWPDLDTAQPVLRGRRVGDRQPAEDTDETDNV